MKSFWIVAFASTGLSLILGLSLWSALPEPVPVHFDVLGNPTSYSSKLSLVVWGPILNFLSILAVNILLKFTIARKAPELKIEKSLLYLNLAMSTIFLFLQAGIILPAYNADAFKFDSFFAHGLSCFFGLIGLSLRDIPQNNFIGVRNRWTLQSNENWMATHKFAFKILGLACFLSTLGFFLSGEIVITFYFGILSFAGIHYFSYRFSKRSNP